MALTLYVPFFREVFHFGVLHLKDLVFSFAAGAISLAWFEVLKFTRRAR